MMLLLVRLHCAKSCSSCGSFLLSTNGLFLASAEVFTNPGVRFRCVLMLPRAAWRDLETSSVQPGQSLDYPSAWSPSRLRFVCGFFRILPRSAEVSPLFPLFAIALGVS